MKLPKKKVKSIFNLSFGKVKLFISKHYNAILFISSYIIFYLSLEKCLMGEEICGNNMKWIYTKVFEIILSCEIISYLVVKMLFYDLSKLNLIHLIIIFSLFYIYSHRFFFFDHGKYNLILFLILLFINIIVILLFKAIVFIFKIKSKIHKALKLFLIFFFVLLYNLNFPNFGCSDWEKGLNNTSIDNDELTYGCKMIIPKYCQYKLFSRFQDYSKMLGVNCSKKKSNYRDIILENSNSPYITKNTKKFGFPLTNKGSIGCLDGLDTDILQTYVVDNLFDLDNNFKNFREPEIIVDFSKDPLGELDIKIKYNESLSKERKKLENKTIPYSKNLVVIYIDSVSRPESLRQLNKTLSFIEKFISFDGGFNEKYPDEKFHSFQFFKYQSFTGRTAANYPVLYYGNKREAKNIVRISKYFNENGYITNYCCDLCKKDNARTLHDLSMDELFDYQMLLCDPNTERYHKPTKKCLYGKIDASYLFDYSERFWRLYPNNRKFSTIILNGAHEGTMEVLKYFDELLYNYFISLFNDNLFKDTSIFLLSDHGIGLHSIYYMFEFYRLEKALPMLYIIINDRKNITYQEQYFHLKENQQTVITAYDIYNTINHLLYGDNYKNILNLTDENPTPKSALGISLLEKIDKKGRKTRNYKNMEYFVCI